MTFSFSCEKPPFVPFRNTDCSHCCVQSFTKWKIKPNQTVFFFYYSTPHVLISGWRCCVRWAPSWSHWFLRRWAEHGSPRMPWEANMMSCSAICSICSFFLFVFLSCKYIPITIKSKMFILNGYWNVKKMTSGCRFLGYLGFFHHVLWGDRTSLTLLGPEQPKTCSTPLYRWMWLKLLCCWAVNI